MSSKDIVKTSKVIKGITSNVRTHFDVFDRARDIYLATIKRAEADYFERIKRATAILTGEEPTAEPAVAASDETPATPQPSA